VRKDCFDQTDPSTGDDGRGRAFECVELDGQRRCLNHCATSQHCRHGRVCLAQCTSNDLSRCPAGTASCGLDGLCRTGQACTPDPSNPRADCQQPGQTCLDGLCGYESFCADGPPLEQNACFPQLTVYQVNVNAGFLVTGTQAGSFSAGRENPTTGLCEPDPNRDKRLVSRIPLRPAPGADSASIECGPGTFPTMQTTNAFDNVLTPPTDGNRGSFDHAGDGFYIDHFDPRIKPVINDNVSGNRLMAGPRWITQEAPQLVGWMEAWTKDIQAPNACLYFGGPIIGDPANDADPNGRLLRPQHLRARFRNTQVAFVLANIERAPSGASILHFDVHGGFRQQAVTNLTTVEISAPARIVLGPFDSRAMGTMAGTPAPYLFVVDQRRLGRGQGGGPTRGQIVRVNPFGLASSNGNSPIYEDFQRSGGQFPIQ
jgi:hypothetical protein